MNICVLLNVEKWPGNSKQQLSYYPRQGSAPPTQLPPAPAPPAPANAQLPPAPPAHAPPAHNPFTPPAPDPPAPAPTEEFSTVPFWPRYLIKTVSS